MLLREYLSPGVEHHGYTVSQTERAERNAGARYDPRGRLARGEWLGRGTGARARPWRAVYDETPHRRAVSETPIEADEQPRCRPGAVSQVWPAAAALPSVHTPQYSWAPPPPAV